MASTTMASLTPPLCVNSTEPSTADQVMDGIGAAGGFILGVCLIPQIVQSIRTKTTADLAYGWQIAYFTGLSCIVLYAAWAGLWPIYAPAVVELLSIVILVALKIKYDGCGKDAWATPAAQVRSVALAATEAKTVEVVVRSDGKSAGAGEEESAAVVEKEEEGKEDGEGGGNAR